MTQDVCTDFAVEDCATRHNYKALGMQTRRHALVDTERRSDFEQGCRAAVRVCVCARVRVCAGAHADAVPSGASATSGAGAATGRSRCLATPAFCCGGARAAALRTLRPLPSGTDAPNAGSLSLLSLCVLHSPPGRNATATCSARGQCKLFLSG